MALAALLSLALLGAASPTSAAPSGFQLAQADPAPAEAPLTTGRTADEEARAAASAAGDPIPNGAPVDDYRFVAWCSGALSEHIALRPRVWEEVQRIERAFPSKDKTPEQSLAEYDEDQKMAEGQLQLFSKALDTQDRKGAEASADRQSAVEQGRQVWRGADTAEVRQLAQLWMSYGLPSRCERVAKKLAGKR